MKFFYVMDIYILLKCIWCDIIFFEIKYIYVNFYKIFFIILVCNEVLIKWSVSYWFVRYGF